MIKLNVTMKALQPLYTGSDEKGGIMNTIRKEKVRLANPVKIESFFQTEDHRRSAVVYILESIWTRIDFKNMENDRKMRIWDEFTSKVFVATWVQTRWQFLNRLTKSFDVRSISDTEIISLLQQFQDDEFLQLIRDELQYLILLLRAKRKNVKDEDSKTGDGTIFFWTKQGNGNLVFEKHFENVPYFSGNGIRGVMRRQAMRDFVKQVGITRLNQKMYHTLFTGGNITDSTGIEDIELRRQLVSMCPMLGVFGAAFGNMTVEGDLKVSGARLRCKENGTGDVSFWELMTSEFSTRRDDEKIEDKIEIVPVNNYPKSQMYYGNEAIVRNAEFDGFFALTSDDPLMVSAFWRMIRLFKDYAFIGGRSAADHGMIDLQVEIPDDAEKAYFEYIEKNKSEIINYFSA